MLLADDMTEEELLEAVTEQHALAAIPRPRAATEEN
jgi:hypothetical protein